MRRHIAMFSFILIAIGACATSPGGSGYDGSSMAAKAGGSVAGGGGQAEGSVIRSSK
jgi:hypothetical protein